MSEDFKREFFQKLVFHENSQLGDNTETVYYLWEIFEKLYNIGNDISQRILSNFLLVKSKIQIFSSKKGSFYNYFAGFIAIDHNDSYVAPIHELGHFYLNLLLWDQMPDNFDIINENAKQHMLSVKNCDYVFNHKNFSNGRFLTLIQEISKDEFRDEFHLEYGLFSDIISSIWLGTNSFHTKDGDRYLLPTGHQTSEFMNNDGKIDYNLVFNEQFANFFAIYMLQNQEILTLLQTFMGNDWYQFMMNTMLKIDRILQEKKENGLSK